MTSPAPTPPAYPTFPAAPAASAQTPESAPPARHRRYPFIFGVTLAVLTILTLALAAIAPSVQSSANQATPAGWSQVYSADLTAATDNRWDETQGCGFNRLGLDASPDNSSDAFCAFTPATTSDVTSQGFYFSAQIAPAATTPKLEQALLLVGDQSGGGLRFEVDQQGRYILCDSSCYSSGSIYIHGGTAAWHGNSYVPNTIAVMVTPDHTQATFYINGQQVATVTTSLGSQPALILGSPSGSEAIFTHATLYTGQ